VNASDDIIESAKPPKPPKPPEAHGPGSRPSFLRQAVAVAAVATAVFTGITAWETHQERVNTKSFYCSFAPDPATTPQEKELVEQLGC
jgi:hypothetical protein